MGCGIGVEGCDAGWRIWYQQSAYMPALIVVDAASEAQSTFHPRTPAR